MSPLDRDRPGALRFARRGDGFAPGSLPAPGRGAAAGLALRLGAGRPRPAARAGPWWSPASTSTPSSSRTSPSRWRSSFRAGLDRAALPEAHLPTAATPRALVVDAAAVSLPRRRPAGAPRAPGPGAWLGAERPRGGRRPARRRRSCPQLFRLPEPLRTPNGVLAEGAPPRVRRRRRSASCATARTSPAPPRGVRDRLVALPHGAPASPSCSPRACSSTSTSASAATA